MVAFVVPACACTIGRDKDYERRTLSLRYYPYTRIPLAESYLKTDINLAGVVHCS